MKHNRVEKYELLRLSVFGVLFLASTLLAVVGLSMNSREAKARYETLIAVDQSGGDVEKALNDLRTYIYSHMNTQIGSETGIKPPIQLRGTYERLVAEGNKSNDTLYEEAQADCERRQPGGFSGSNRLACIEAYVDANGQQQVAIEDDFYKFDFVPPRWSPDLAGLSIVSAVITGFAFLVELLIYLRVRRSERFSR